jgi:PelA/Pel-15E family pectate lyase
LAALVGLTVDRAGAVTSAAASVVRKDERGRNARRSILATLKAYRGTNPWVLTDRPIYAIRAGLLPLPELAVFSQKRMRLLRGDPRYLTSLLIKYDRPQVLLLRRRHYPAPFVAALRRTHVRFERDFQQARHFVQPAAIPIGRRPRLDEFRDGIAHYQRNTPGEHLRYSESDVVSIADNLLLLQNDDGGWPANHDPRVVYAAADKRELADRHQKFARLQRKSLAKGRIYKEIKGSSLDNGATVAEIKYLIQVAELTGTGSYRDAARRGIEYLLGAQTACGGWPHSFPPTELYHSHITFMDGVSTGALELLQRVALRQPPYDSLPTALRLRARAAGDRGLDCILRLQVRLDGQLAGWAGQYDEKTLEPTAARAFELASMASRETVAIVEYLMTLEDARQPVIDAIEGAVRWLRAARLTDLELRRVALPSDASPGGRAYDLELQPSPGAAPLWARFYEIPSNRPFVADRDGLKLYDWRQLSHERRTDYDWYGSFANHLLDVGYPDWTARRARSPSTIAQ